MPKYLEYSVTVDGLEKRLGIIGEHHIYSKSESDHVEEIVRTYDTIAIEGSGEATLFDYLATPMFLAIYYGTKKTHTTALSHAKKQEKDIVYLEDNKDLPLGVRCFLYSFALISIPLAPLMYVYLSIVGEPLEEEESSKTSSNSDRPQFCVQRDKIMADKAIDLITDEKDNMLVICGRNHLEGIVSELNYRLDMTETDRKMY